MTKLSVVYFDQLTPIAYFSWSIISQFSLVFPLYSSCKKPKLQLRVSARPGNIVIILQLNYVGMFISRFSQGAKQSSGCEPAFRCSSFSQKFANMIACFSGTAFLYVNAEK